MSSKLFANNDSDALRLAKRLDGLPLALVLAGSFLGLKGASPTRYLRYYEESWNKINQRVDVPDDYTNGTIVTT